jgi:23S rRNA (uridine2552-2'-O)-methyltransferase
MVRRMRRPPRSAKGDGKGSYRRKDSYFLRAKAEGYRSRAAYKLLELAKRYRVLRPGARVLDLGCWPGGWTQVAVELAGPSGRVVGVDLRATEPIAGAVLIVGDVREEETLRRLEAAIDGPLDVLLSDMAPQLSGVRARDEARAYELGCLALDLADRLLAPGGHLIMKIFMSPETESLLLRARAAFATVKLSRPDASRKGSAEQYLIAVGRR